MNIDQAFPSNYLKAADLSGDTPLTISSVAVETIGEDSKPVVYFTERETGLVLNKTNKETIKSLTGTSETDKWIGKQIVLFPTQVDFQGKQVEAIRIRLRAPIQPAHDATSAFWAYAYQHEVAKPDAQAYLNEAGGDFSRALELMKMQVA